MMKRKQSLGGLLLLSLLMMMLLVPPAMAVDYYVRPDGDDGNAGTANTPGGAWQTIGRVRFGVYSPGDVVHIASGVYDENASYGIFFGNVTIRGATPDRPVLRRIEFDIQGGVSNLTLENLDFNNAETHINIVQVRQGVANLSLIGCDLRNPLNQADPDGTRNHGCLTVEQADNVLLDTCRFVYNPNSPILGRSYNVSTHVLLPPSNNWTIRNCYFSMNPQIPSTAGGNLIFWSGIANLTVEDCVFAYAPREHIGVSNQVEVAPVHNLENWTIRRNQFLGNSTTALLGIGYAHYVTNWVIEDNFFTQGNDQGIYFWSSGAPFSVATVVDGFVVTGNTFEDMGRGTGVFAEGLILLNNVEFRPSPGRQTAVTNNTFRDTRGGAHGGWGVYVHGNGPGPIVADNTFENIREACILVTGSPYDAVGDREQGCVDTVVVGNTILGNVYGGVVVRYEVTADGPGVVRNTKIENNLIQNCNQYGISVEMSHAYNTTIRFNDIVQCGAGIQIAGESTIRSNEIFSSVNAARGGIWLSPFATDSDVSNSVVAFNLTTGCAGYGIRVQPTLGTRGQNLKIFNNTLVGNQNDGMLIGVDGLTAYNNIIALHTGTGMVFSATTVGTLGYNLHYNVFAGGQDFSGFPGPTNFPGDLVGQDPMFVDFSALNFRLQPGSPAILAGGLLVGSQLIAGGGDMGAYPSGVVSAEVRKAAWELYR